VKPPIILGSKINRGHKMNRWPDPAAGWASRSRFQFSIEIYFVDPSILWRSLT